MTDPGVDAARGRAREWLWLLALGGLAVGARVAFVSAFPTRPFADFRNLVRFAEAYAADGLARGAPGWEMWSLGLPLALSFVLRLFPGPPPDVARMATAVVTGLTALAPFLIWRGAVSLRGRVMAAVLLAAWPGHVLVSGVVSQDNWVLLPSVALAALAVRVMRRNDAGHPLAAALLWGLGGAIRQEMFVVLLPAAAAAAGLARPWRVPERRRLAAFALAALLAMTSLAALRWAGSGRFSLGTEHPGVAVLGACAPGAGSSYWTFAQTYFAAVAPEVAEDWEEMKRRAGGLAVREMLRRPRFHAVRMVAAGTNSLLRTDADGLFTSIASEEAMPRLYLPRGLRLAEAARPLLMKATLALAARWPGHRAVLGAALAGLAAAALLFAVAARSEDWIVRNEEQLTYRFVLKDPRRDARLSCMVRQGLLTLLYAPRSAAIRPLQANPGPGQAATAECVVEARRDTDGLVFAFRDPFPTGGLPGRMQQVVTLDGREVLRHDLAAAPGSDWLTVPLGPLEDGARRTLTLSVVALRPEPGLGWGLTANTAFRLAYAGAAD